MSLRHASQHHLAIGVEYCGKRVLALINMNSVTIVHLDAGEIFATNTMNRNATSNATP